MSESDIELPFLFLGGVCESGGQYNYNDCDDTDDDERQPRLEKTSKTGDGWMSRITMHRVSKFTCR